MTNIVKTLHDKGLIHPPPWLPLNTMYLTIMGSTAYGCADTSVKKNRVADIDVYGFAIPPKDFIFPHLRGHIPGFGTHPPSFEQYQKHNIMDKEANAGRGEEYDLNISNIVKYFELCRDNNPNMIDSLFTPENCVIHCTSIGQIVRDNRRLFLSKLCWKKFRGYALTQLKKMNTKSQTPQMQQNIESLREFEMNHEIDQKTSFEDVKKEMKKRGLAIS